MQRISRCPGTRAAGKSPRRADDAAVHRGLRAAVDTVIRRFAAGLVLLGLTLALPASAQQSERYGPYELHYSVLNSTFIQPEVAAQYGITRGDRRGLINVALREHLADGTAVNRAMDLTGESWDLTGRRDAFDFIEIREGPAVYYIGEFKFLNREWRHFRLSFTPENSEERFELKFKRQMYEEQ